MLLYRQNNQFLRLPAGVAGDLSVAGDLAPSSVAGDPAPSGMAGDLEPSGQQLAVSSETWQPVIQLSANSTPAQVRLYKWVDSLVAILSDVTTNIGNQQ